MARTVVSFSFEIVTCMEAKALNTRINKVWVFDHYLLIDEVNQCLSRDPAFSQPRIACASALTETHPPSMQRGTRLPDCICHIKGLAHVANYKNYNTASNKMCESTTACERD